MFSSLHVLTQSVNAASVVDISRGIQITTEDNELQRGSYPGAGLDGVDEIISVHA